MTPSPATRLIRFAECQKRVGLPKSTMWKKIADGSFVQPLKLSERSIAFIEHEVEEWIAARIAARPAKAH